MIAVFLAISNTRAERLRMMHDHFKEPDPQVPLNIVAAVLAIFTIFVLMRLLSYLQARRLDAAAKVQPMSLYWRVQARMGVPLLDRWRLWRLARKVGLQNPTALLISPVLFDRAVESYPGGCGRAGQFAGIRKRLFGQAAPLPIESSRAG